MKLVELKRQDGNGHADVVAAVGPLADADADAYASLLLRAVEQHADHGLSVGTTTVVSASSRTAGPPAEPADLLRAVLASNDGSLGGDHELPEPDVRG